MFTFTRNCASEQDILLHLQKCDKMFTPFLSQRVNIYDYARKIHKNAERFEAWEGRRLAAMVCAYINSGEAFITNVSVELEYQGLGLASSLTKDLVSFASGEKLFLIKLEVHKENTPAVKLYRKLGFCYENISDAQGTMILKVGQRNEK